MLFNPYQVALKDASENAERLNVQTHATANPYTISFTPETFSFEYKARFPNSVVFNQLNVVFQKPRAQNSYNVYYASTISYVIEESKTCSGKLYNKPKRNTYTLCPICNPFGTNEFKAHFEKREGTQLEFDGNEPRFYDTLHSKYDHHMNHVHGVYKDGCKAQQPMIVLTETLNSGFQLNTLCPMASKEDNHACLWINKINTKSGENPLKAYLRHFTTFHNKNGNKSDCGEIYTPMQCLYPVDLDAFESSLIDLNNQCVQPANITYSRNSEAVSPIVEIPKTDEFTAEDLAVLLKELPQLEDEDDLLSDENDLNLEQFIISEDDMLQQASLTNTVYLEEPSNLLMNPQSIVFSDEWFDHHFNVSESGSVLDSEDSSIPVSVYETQADAVQQLHIESNKPFDIPSISTTVQLSPANKVSKPQSKSSRNRSSSTATSVPVIEKSVNQDFDLENFSTISDELLNSFITGEVSEDLFDLAG